MEVGGDGGRCEAAVVRWVLDGNLPFMGLMIRLGAGTGPKARRRRERGLGWCAVVPVEAGRFEQGVDEMSGKCRWMCGWAVMAAVRSKLGQGRRCLREGVGEVCGWCGKLVARRPGKRGLQDSDEHKQP